MKDVESNFFFFRLLYVRTHDDRTVSQVKTGGKTKKGPKLVLGVLFGAYAPLLPSEGDVSQPVSSRVLSYIQAQVVYEVHSVLFS